MRVAVVTTSYPENEGDPSGHFVATEVRALVRTGHEVTVVSPRAGGAFGWPGVAARIRERPHRAVEAAAWCVSARRELLALRPLDRVIAHWAVPCGAIALGCAASIEVVSHGADVRAIARMPRAVRGVIVGGLARRVETWRFVSAALLDELARSLGRGTRAALERVARVEACAIDMPRMEDVEEHAAAKRRGLGVARGDRAVAVAVGRLVAGKRVEVAIAHAAREKHVLVVVGDGPERGRLEGLARALGVDARFVGKVPRGEALAWIRAADFVVHASRAEGLSTVVREAEALGVPVVNARG